MKFGNPEYFLFWLFIPVLIGFFIWAYQRKKATLKKFATLELLGKLTQSAGLGRQITKWTIFCLFYFFLVIALVRPRFGLKMEMIERKGIDIIVALDISQSMLAEDIAPNRIDRAKHEISKFIDLLKGDRIGIVVFAGESFVQCPLTLDYGAAKMFLDAVSPGWVQIQGTALNDAIHQSTEAFRSKNKKQKVLIIITDGEDHQGNAIEAAKAANQEGVIIYTIGVGSENGVPIPTTHGNGNVIYKKDQNGNIVLTKLNSAILEQIAMEGKGKYFHAGTDLDFSKILSEIAKLEKQDFGAKNLVTYEEQYQIFLFIALVLILLEFFLPERSRKKEEWKGRFE